MVTNAQLQMKYKRKRREGFPFEFKGELMPISKETANKLLQGEFKTFEELEDADFNPTNSNIEILYRKIENTNREEFVYVIETIFINE